MSGPDRRGVRSWRVLVVSVALQAAAGATLEAQPYGLDTRPAAQPYLGMPASLPTPSGDFVTELAFPNLTFQNPVFLTHAPSSNIMYVCEREGRIYSFPNDPGTSSKTLVLDVSAQTQGWDDCGLLGMAFHPEFGVSGSPNRGYFYVLYQYSDNPVPGPNRPPATTPAYNRLSRFTIPDGMFVADPASELVLIHQHDRHVWHNGGAMFFHPVDGFLYFTIGDEGGANDTYDSSQKIDDKLFGGVFRIDVDMQGGSVSHPIRRQPQSYSGRPAYTQNYYIPNDNPWQDTGGGVLEEFWALGVRSPHRMTHDAIDDLIFLGDVGQGSWEEVSVIEKAGNYQWPYKEGFHDGARSPPATLIGTEKPPIYDYPHGSTFPFNGNCVVGGYIYRGTEHPDLYGQYIFGDNTRGRIWAMDLSTNPPTVTYLCNMPAGSNYNGLSSFGVGPDNELYLCKMGHTGPGYIYKLGRTGTTGPPVPPLLSQTGAFSDVVNLTASSELIPFDVGSPLWSDSAIKTRWISVPNTGAIPATDEQIAFGATGEWSFPTGTVFVKHFELVVDEVTLARRRLETRLVVQKNDGGVYGVTYKWRPDESDADLILNGLEEDITIATASGSRVQTWSYPSSSQCLTCHNTSAEHVLGIKTRQLNRDFAYPLSGVTDNQLRAWNHIGLFDPPVNELDIPTFASLVTATDTSATLEHRVRSYIDANCGHCHRPGHVQAFFDARFDTPLAQQGLIDGVVGNDLGIDNAAVIRAKDRHRSLLYVRDNSLDPFVKMPPLAKNTIDEDWIATLDAWIDSLPGTPALDPPVVSPAGGNFDEMVDVTITAAVGSDIYYTLNGSAPDTSSTLYTGTFTLTSSATVRARAYQSGFVESVVASADFVVTNFRAPENPTGVAAGVNYEQYLGTWDFLPDFDAMTADEVGIRPNFDISPRIQNDNFGFRFTGFIDIPQTGIYTFYTNSDDGSQLFIGSQLVVDNDGLHAPAETSGQIALAAGLHAITVTFFEKGGGEVLEVRYEGPGLAKSLVPDSALYHEKIPATVNLSDLTVVYDGNPVSMTATTNPPGLTVDITYDGSPLAPTDAGVYSVVGTINDPDYQGSATATLTIDPALATIVLAGLNPTYDGTPKPISATTTPPGLVVSITYDGGAVAPTDAGGYAVVADVIDANYTGTTADTLVIDPASATIALSGLNQTYDGSPRTVTATTTPAGLAVDITYDGSTSAPTDAGSYGVSAVVTDSNYTGTANDTLVVDPASATIALSGLAQTYDGTPRVVTATTTPAGLAVSLTYDGSASAPTNSGSYAVTATITDANHTGSANGTLTVAPAAATISLSGLSQTYDGTPKSAIATTTPPGLAVSMTYDGSSTPPVGAGSYSVDATITDLNYTGSSSGTLVIGPAAATVSLSGLAQTYDGSPRVVSATTVPAGLTVDITYDGSAAAPTDAGNYAIDAVVNDANYAGSASGTLVVSQGTATVSLADLAQTYDGSPRVVSATTVPAGLTVDITYDGSTTAPVDAGSYSVAATVNDPNYSGSNSGTLVVSQAAATVTLGGLAQTFDGTPRIVPATTTPAGLAVDVTYNGSATAPTDAGSYSVAATVNDSNYTGSASDTLVVSQAAATVTLSGLSQTYDGGPRVVTATTTPAGLTVDITYNGSSTAPTDAGSYSVSATVNDTNYTGSNAGTLVVSQASATVALSGLAQTYDGSPRVVTATTTPTGLTVDITYNGSATAPTDAGSYSVSATVNDTNYTGSNAGTLVVSQAAATISLGGLAQTYDGGPRVVSATTTPAGLSVDITYDGSSTAPTDAGSYAVSATVNDTNYTGSAADTLVVAKAAATVTLSGLTQAYDGSPRIVTATTAPAGLAVDITYDGSATPPTEVGSYAVSAVVNEINYTGSANGTLEVGNGVATVTLGGLAQTFDGTPRIVSATTTPAGLAVDITYDGSAVAPTNAGSYAVLATVNDPNYVGSASDTLVVTQAGATVTLSGLSQTYDGSPRVVSATTTPAGLTVDITYNGSATAPIDAGSYSVSATVNDTNYTGSNAGTLVVSQASATVALGGLAQTYDGSPRIVSATTTPAGLTVDITYDGSSTAPTDAGSYSVSATVNDTNYTGSNAGTLVVSQAAATISLGGLAQTFDGTPRVVSATTTPAGLTVDITYDGSSTAPTDAGSYAVSATVNDTNYTGSAADTLVVAKATATVTLSGLTQAYDGSPRIVTATTAPAGLAVDITYDGSATPPTEVGSYAVSAVVNEINYTGSASGTLTVEAASPEVSFETGIATGVGTDAWTTVNLSRLYSAMVVVCTPVVPGSFAPIVARVQNAAGSSFDLRAARLDGSTTAITGISFHYFVVEAGVYTTAVHGVTMEAVRFDSVRTDENNSWLGEQRTYANSYTAPVVLGQVMTANDSRFSVFWARGGGVASAPSSSDFWVGKHVAEDPVTTRANETIGYLVFETGSGMIGDVPFIAGVGSDSILGTGNSPPYTYPISGLPTNAATVTLSSAGMDGNNGGWPVLYGPTPFSASHIDLAIDEDLLGDTERSHTNEQVAYLVCGTSLNVPPTVELFAASPVVIFEGESTLLEWETTNATNVSIDQGVGGVGVDGSIVVTPTQTTQYTLTATGPAGSVEASATVTVQPAPQIAFERGVVTGLSSSSWTVVNLSESYASMVVVCTPNYDSSSPPIVIRVRNATGSSFEAQAARVDGSTATLSGISAHYMVIEEGVYTDGTHGVKLEAVRTTSAVTDNASSWVGESRGYANAYTNPVVLGQVVTANDGDFSVFWCRGSSRQNPPSSSELWVGKHVAEDSDTTRVAEEIAYVVVEAGADRIGDVSFVAGLGADSVRSMDNSPPYSYSIAGLATASVGIATQAAMDGGNGSWAILYGANPVRATQLQLVVDEDQLKDSERKHTAEQVGYIIFE